MLRLPYLIPVLAFSALACANQTWGKFWEVSNAQKRNWLSYDPRGVGNLIAWYKADSIAQADGTPVTNWVDSSGTGNDVTASSLPTFYKTTHQINARPVVRFVAASSQAFSRASINNPPLSDSGSMFLVMRPLTNSAMSPLTIGGICDNARQFTWLNPATIEINKKCGGQVAVIPISWPVGSVRELTVLQNAATNLLVRLDGAQIYDGIPALSGYTNQNVYVGSNGDDGEYLDADLAEIIFYSNRLTDVESREIECYLGAKYGTLACP